MVLPQSIFLCQTFQVFFAGSPYVVSLAPKGTCHLCCEINLEEDIIFMSHEVSRSDAGDSVTSRRAGVVAGVPGIDPGKPTVLYIHGFTEQGTGESATTVRDAYFTSGRDVNFITMDWARLVSFPWYSQAVSNTQIAGRYLALFLDRLALDGVAPSSVHLVGFSLGAEVAGFAGKHLMIGKLGRITGLDPAFPLFRVAGTTGHLSYTDADFVDVIHTDAGGWGFPTSIGHADFFPNGGRAVQPGCAAREMTERGLYPVDFIACSHNRAWQYFAESVRHPEGFPALRCASAAEYASGQCNARRARLLGAGTGRSNSSDLAVMGLAAPSSCRGKYFLDTNHEAPYARGLSFRSAEEGIESEQIV